MEMFSYGYPVNIANNTIRAFPSAGGRVFITASTATSVDISNDSNMANAKNLVPATDPAFTTGGMTIGAGFIRVNGGAAIVRVSKV